MSSRDPTAATTVTMAFPHAGRQAVLMAWSTPGIWTAIITRERLKWLKVGSAKDEIAVEGHE